MTKDIVIRGIDEEVVAMLDQLRGDTSREEFIRRKLAEIAAAGEVPPSRHGKGLRAFTPTGGKARLVQYIESVGGGAAQLSEEEYAAYQRARLVAHPRNGGKWAEAKRLLDEAGFEVFWD